MEAVVLDKDTLYESQRKFIGKKIEVKEYGYAGEKTYQLDGEFPLFFESELQFASDKEKLERMTALAWEMAYRLTPDPDKVSLPLGLSSWEKQIKEILED